MKKQMTIKKAALLNAVAKYATVFIQLVFTAILSRILTPNDYGTVAVITVFISFFQLFADMGLGVGVIQNKELSSDEINDIFSFTAYFGFVLMIVFAVLSIPISIIYENKIYIPLGIILSISVFFNSLNMIPNSMLLKEKRFVSIAMRTVSTVVISYLLTIAFALKGFGVYALAGSSVVHATTLFIWNELSTKLKFHFHPNINSIKKIWSYSVFQFGAQTINYFNRNLDNLLIGKFFSTSELGYYNKAYTLTGYPINYLPGVINPVLHPILSEHQDDKQYIYSSYVKLLRVLSLLGCFGAAFCFFASREIILIVFGGQWELSITPFKILSLSLWMQILTNTIAPIYQSIGNTKLLFKSTVITTALIVSSIITGVLLGTITTVSICVSVAYILNFFVSFAFMIKAAFKKSLIVFLTNFRHELLFFVIFLAVALLWPFYIENLIISFIAKFFSFTVIYIILLIISKQHRVLLGFLKR